MNSIKQYVNSTKQCINSDPCEVTVHAQKKKKDKKKTWTWKNAQAKRSHRGKIVGKDDYKSPIYFIQSWLVKDCNMFPDRLCKSGESKIVSVFFIETVFCVVVS